MYEILSSKIIGNSQNHLIILHGIFGMNDNWNRIGKELSTSFTVHLIDIRNHGFSFHSNEMDYPLMAMDVINYLNHHKVKKSCIIGHSMGGKITMQAVLDYPEYFNKAAIIDISPVKYLPQHNEVINALRTLDLTSITKRQEINEHLKKYIKEESVVMWIMKSIYLDEKVYKFRFNLPTILTNYDLLSESIEVKENKTSIAPIIFLKGEKSDYIKLPEDEEKIHAIFKNYRLVEIPNAGHWTHVDNPTAIIEQLNNFLLN